MRIQIPLLIITLLAISGCDVNLWVDDDDNTPRSDESSSLVAFDPDSTLEAQIRWTDFGVPHITADNLESLAFGSALAYARDNYCTIAEQMVRIRSERSRYFGPDQVPGSGDSFHLISDFGLKALKLIDSAKEGYADFSVTTRAMLEGYSAGLNQHFSETGPANLATHCADAGWLAVIEPHELAAYYQSINLQGTSAQPVFLNLAFMANPGDEGEFLPYTQTPGETSNQNTHWQPDTSLLAPTTSEHTSLGSNAWALGSAMTDSGGGVLLGNPHFPMVDNQRFWQSHLTIPGELDVMGGSLQGFPTVQMGFNESIAWTHTVTAAEHSALYQLELTAGDRESYEVDGQPRPIEKETFQIEVLGENGETTEFFKDYYYAHHGLIIEAQPELAPLGWDDENAYALRDAVAGNRDSLDHWLSIGLASNIGEFEQAFRTYDGMAFVNTLYADKVGNAFYIDDSAVLHFSDQALDALASDPEIQTSFDTFGIYVLPAKTELFEPAGDTPYERAPQLRRVDFVQNSNDNYWASNPAAPLSGYSPLYGQAQSPLSLRTRMSLQLLNDSAGPDGLFSAADVEAALLSNRVYLGELILPDLLSQCAGVGTTPIATTSGTTIDISEACSILASWDGTANLSSIGAHVFREFAYQFNPFTQLTGTFNPANAATTPDTLTDDGSPLTSLATAVENLQRGGIALTSTLGEVQFFEKPNSEANVERLPWAGPSEVAGGFNIFHPALQSDSLIPRPSHDTVLDTMGVPLPSGLSTDGYPVQFGSTWMFTVEFDESGPSARGLLTSSQSSDARSPHYADQSRLYSEQPTLRPLYFSESDVQTHTVETVNASLTR